MLSKYLLLPAVLGIAGLLSAPDVVLAQHGGHGGGHGGGGHAGGGHVGAVHGGGGYGGGRGYGYGGRGYGYGGRGYGYGGYGWGGYGYPGWGGYYGGGYWPSYYDGTPYYSGDTYVNPNYTTYIDPSTTAVNPAPQVADNTAGVRVILPDPAARVWFDGTATNQTGTDRLFHTPSLAAGSYSYRIKATWTQNGREVTQERNVPVMAGRLSVVDFTRPPSEALSTPTTGQ